MAASETEISSARKRGAKMGLVELIKEVVFGMYNDKAPGPDGLPALFYKRYWSIVGKSVCDAVLNFFKSGHLLTEIIAKILVSRIRPVLDSLISPCQSAFIPDRWIVENQLIVQEILHSFKKRKVKGGFVALKVDLQKAYDRVNWSFLKEVLYRFGFHEKFIMWIMQCVTKVSFSILINGGKTKSFILPVGLRQGDPLSPYLFILCQEVLSRLIERSFASGAIHGVKMNTNGPAFTHVMYADDLMLFAKATTCEVQVLDECLEKYCEWFGQLINREKSGLIFSKLVVRERKRAIKLELNMKAISTAATYLSAPLFTSRSRTKDFKFLQDRLESKLKGWRCKSLSWAGRSTLIKSVAQALPTYTFASSDVPVAVCDKLDAATRRFWWKPNRESGSYLAWKAWDHLCSPKGLFETSTKLIGNGCIEKIQKILPRPRRAIERLKALIIKGACYIVGDGARIDIWKDPWVPLASRLSAKTKVWLVNAITKIPIPSTPSPDKLVWIHEPKGLFSVKSAYKCNQLEHPHISGSNIWSKLWKLNLHERSKMFIWRLGSGVLPTNLNFFLRVGHGNPKCPLCLTEDESIEHLFFKCNFARAMWFGLSWALRPDLINVASCSDIVELVVNPPMRPGENSCKSLKQRLSIHFALTLEHIWTCRNKAMELITALSQINLFWMAPPADVTKLNTDVAVRGNRSTIAVIARGESGAVVKAWAKVVDIEDPLVAEAIAIKWALELAESESFPNVIVESDSKICIDNFSDNSTSSYWKIDALIPDVHRLALHFLSCCFAWVKREANMVAHELAQSFSALSSVFSCNATSLPPSVFEAWKRDLLGLSLA
uniref:Reverse transcriptase domain-containing protein n=1 Tax=Fagus sylvatica TaxID=28930 RepID=A0A2N9GB01_FAGSY